MTNVASFGFLGSSLGNVAALGFLGASIPPPPPAAPLIVPGVADKRKRDREEYFRKRRLRHKKQAREIDRSPATREEPVTVVQHQPIYADAVPNRLLFRGKVGPISDPPPKAQALAPLPDIPEHHDDEDVFLLGSE